MLVLAIDTTGATGSLALLEDAQLLEERPLAGPDGFGHILFPAIGELLATHGRVLRDVDLFAAAAGPGSFTGVRVGLTAIKGLAEAHGKPGAGISNLRALAAFGTAPLRAPWVDARRGEVYGGVYDAALRLVQAEAVAPLEQWRAALPEGAELVEQTPDRLLAAAIARIARQEGGQDPAGLDANYIRRSDAELLFKPPV